jgi:glutaminyl-peptide cyclotransferase
MKCHLRYSMGHQLSSLLHLHLLIVAVIAYQPLSDESLRGVTLNEADFDIADGALLAPLLIPRVPGTSGQVKAQEHFVDFFREELPAWSVEWQNSTSTTPSTGDEQLPFANLIVRREPPWTTRGQANYLTLAAHYDSKFKPDGFIGATDSAAPCAMLMHTARFLEKYLQQTYDRMEAEGEKGGTPTADMGVQILLLDGEEAFKSWTDTDSLYGSRSLAEEWEHSFHPVKSGYREPLSQISLFVLLDLLGAANPKVPSYFLTTHWAYKAMASIEERMRRLGLLESEPRAPFLPDAAKSSVQFRRYIVEDDHVPFMERGVPILHIITSPFPPVWHTMMDDGEHLDMPTVRDWVKITTAFALEWLDIDVDVP